ncbi:fungal-specific transcription factor domain-containing protein [Daldinia decipiens]|uniref:fungal-specific transcription factor domain-containing protein n=1 Tax=Daldinia decipiens TaxID=326647 RepID=UPI0020C1DE9F|nr:fungal-specific transcription factor domain-containing protein [Daldinia decipiens]KAI1657666.1 fungal-specific transcription factor domain-containing protein [Daldinia decipiens]
MDSRPPAGTAQRPQSKPLSCTNCRARKLKCSREHPCSHCVRSGAECIFPTRKRMRKPRANKNLDLLQRLSRLESIVGKVSASGLEGANVAELVPDSAPGLSTAPLALGAATKPTAPSESQDNWKKAFQDSKASRYLSGEFWSSLCLEVEGLRQALESSTDSDDEEQQMLQGDTPESVTNDNSSPGTYALSPGMLLGNSPRISYDHIEHPSPQHILFLTSTFFTNVDMILKILHRPTIREGLRSLAHSPETARSQLTPEKEALHFSIYYAAVASLSPSTCLAQLGRRREELLQLYSSTLEYLLVRADYLSSTSLETLQALTLYVACVRCNTKGSRASWALLSLPIRLAQALDLHHESSNAHLSPFHAEMRRRLWWQLIVLDIRASEDRGTNTIVARGSYDTRLPLNINDDDFGPDSRGPLVERQGPSDMTFNLCTARCSGLFLAVEHAQDAPGIEDSGPPSKGVEETLKHAQSLEAQFVVGADTNHVPSHLASIMVRLVILKLWLIMQYPLHPRRRPQAASASRQGRAGAAGNVFPHEATLRTAISIVELNDHLATGPYGERFSWWVATYVQWHPLAVALAELCTQTRGELVDRAWQTVEDVLPKWSEVIADTKNGTLWRPIRKLYKKAKAARLATTNTADTTTPTATTNTTGVTMATIDSSDVQIQDTLYVQTNSLESGIPPIEGGYTTAVQPESIYGAEIRDAREPSVPADLEKLSLSPYALNELWGWRDLNFDIPMLDIGGPNVMTDWSTWDDFVTETQADPDKQSKSGSSEVSNQ